MLNTENSTLRQPALNFNYVLLEWSICQKFIQNGKYRDALKICVSCIKHMAFLNSESPEMSLFSLKLVFNRARLSSCTYFFFHLILVCNDHITAIKAYHSAIFISNSLLGTLFSHPGLNHTTKDTFVIFYEQHLRCLCAILDIPTVDKNRNFSPLNISEFHESRTAEALIYTSNDELSELSENDDIPQFLPIESHKLSILTRTKLFFCILSIAGNCLKNLVHVLETLNKLQSSDYLVSLRKSIDLVSLILFDSQTIARSTIASLPNLQSNDENKSFSVGLNATNGNGNINVLHGIQDILENGDIELTEEDMEENLYENSQRTLTNGGSKIIPGSLSKNDGSCHIIEFECQKIQLLAESLSSYSCHLLQLQESILRGKFRMNEYTKRFGSLRSQLLKKSHDTKKTVLRRSQCRELHYEKNNCVEKDLNLFNNDRKYNLFDASDLEVSNLKSKVLIDTPLSISCENRSNIEKKENLRLNKSNRNKKNSPNTPSTRKFAISQAISDLRAASQIQMSPLENISNMLTNPLPSSQNKFENKKFLRIKRNKRKHIFSHTKKQIKIFNSFQRQRNVKSIANLPTTENLLNEKETSKSTNLTHKNVNLALPSKPIAQTTILSSTQSDSKTNVRFPTPHIEKDVSTEQSMMIKLSRSVARLKKIFFHSAPNSKHRSETKSNKSVSRNYNSIKSSNQPSWEEHTIALATIREILSSRLQIERNIEANFIVPPMNVFSIDDNIATQKSEKSSKSAFSSIDLTLINAAENFLSNGGKLPKTAFLSLTPEGFSMEDKLTLIEKARSIEVVDRAFKKNKNDGNSLKSQSQTAITKNNTGQIATKFLTGDQNINFDDEDDTFEEHYAAEELKSRHRRSKIFVKSTIAHFERNGVLIKTELAKCNGNMLKRRRARKKEEIDMLRSGIQPSKAGPTTSIVSILETVGNPQIIHKQIVAKHSTVKKNHLKNKFSTDASMLHHKDTQVSENNRQHYRHDYLKTNLSPLREITSSNLHHGYHIDNSNSIRASSPTNKVTYRHAANGRFNSTSDDASVAADDGDQEENPVTRKFVRNRTAPSSLISVVQRQQLSLDADENLNKIGLSFSLLDNEKGVHSSPIITNSNNKERFSFTKHDTDKNCFGVKYGLELNKTDNFAKFGIGSVFNRTDASSVSTMKKFKKDRKQTNEDFDIPSRIGLSREVTPFEDSLFEKREELESEAALQMKKSRLVKRSKTLSTLPLNTADLQTATTSNKGSNRQGGNNKFSGSDAHHNADNNKEEANNKLLLSMSFAERLKKQKMKNILSKENYNYKSKHVLGISGDDPYAYHPGNHPDSNAYEVPTQNQTLPIVKLLKMSRSIDSPETDIKSRPITLQNQIINPSIILNKNENPQNNHTSSKIGNINLPGIIPPSVASRLETPNQSKFTIYGNLTHEVGKLYNELEEYKRMKNKETLLPHVN